MRGGGGGCASTAAAIVIGGVILGCGTFASAGSPARATGAAGVAGASLARTTGAGFCSRARGAAVRIAAGSGGVNGEGVPGAVPGAGGMTAREAERIGVTVSCVVALLLASSFLAAVSLELPLVAFGSPLHVRISRELLLGVMAGRPHIFNLGHGIDRFTEISHVERLLARLRGDQSRG